MKIIVCRSCGWKELRKNFTQKAQSMIMGAQQSLFESSGKGMCYKCNGGVDVKDIKWKVAQKIIERFPDKKVITTYMSFEDIAVGKGHLEGIEVVE